MTRERAIGAITDSDIYRVFLYMEQLGKTDLYNNVLGLNIAALRESLRTKKLFYLMTGQPITGDNYKEALACLLSYYFQVIESEELAEYNELSAALNSAKFDILNTGTHLRYCIEFGSAPPAALKLCDWQPYYSKVAAYFKTNSVTLEGTDPTKEDFAERALAIAYSKAGVILEYQLRLREIDEYSARITPNNLHIIDLRLKEINNHFTARYNESLRLDEFADLILRMRDEKARHN